MTDLHSQRSSIKSENKSSDVQSPPPFPLLSPVLDPKLHSRHTPSPLHLAAAMYHLALMNQLNQEHCKLSTKCVVERWPINPPWESCALNPPLRNAARP